MQWKLGNTQNNHCYRMQSYSIIKTPSWAVRFCHSSHPSIKIPSWTIRVGSCMGEGGHFCCFWPQSLGMLNEWMCRWWPGSKLSILYGCESFQRQLAERKAHWKKTIMLGKSKAEGKEDPSWDGLIQSGKPRPSVCKIVARLLIIGRLEVINR